MRPDIDSYFLQIAFSVSARSTWTGTKVGCVAVQEKQVVSTGYNGTPAGYSNEVPKTHKHLFCHAEENAVAQAAKHGARLSGAVFYCTVSPCVQCARILVNAGASEVVYAERWDHADEAILALALLQACGVRTRKWGGG